MHVNKIILKDISRYYGSIQKHLVKLNKLKTVFNIPDRIE